MYVILCLSLVPRLSLFRVSLDYISEDRLAATGIPWVSAELPLLLKDFHGV